jgi:hypothetical protein
MVRTVQPEHVEHLLEVRGVEVKFPPMTEEQAADWLRSVPRETPVERFEAGLWVGNQIVRHEYGESRDSL